MRRRSPWAADTVDAFLAATAHSQLEAAWHLLAVIGLGVGEVLALRWADVDPTTGLIHVRHAVVGVPYAALAAPDWANGERVVDARPVLDVLDRHYRRQAAARTEWDVEYRDDGLVVCREDGRPLHPRDLHRAFGCADADTGLPGLRLSDLCRRRRRIESLVESRS
jgi:integrase